MHKKPRNKGSLVALAVTVALLIALLTYGGSNAAPQAVNPGGSASCQVDGSGYCTVAHNLGYTPAGVVVTSKRIGQLGTTDQFTATTFRVRWWWYEPVNGSNLFAAGTRIDFSWSPAGETVAATTPPPTTATPPASTPPTSTPPPTSPTNTASPVKTCTNGTTIPEGSGVTFSNYFVHNNNWNDNYGGSHTIVACNYDNWYLTTSIPSHSDGAVEAYPNVHRDYNNVPVTQIQSANFAMKTPTTCAGCIYDVAFDIWIGSGLNNELMIWTDNLGQTPGGTKQANPVTFGGVTYDVWHSSGYTAYVARVTQKYGTMPLQSFFNDMKTRGWAPSTATTWQVDYGVETVTTAGVSQRFDLTDFSISDGTTVAAAGTKNETAAKQHLHNLGLDR